MPDFFYDPPIAPTLGFTQLVRMAESGRSIGTARWHVAEDSTDGIVQILDFSITAKLRRKGNGKRLIAAVIEQIRLYHRAREVP